MVFTLHINLTQLFLCENTGTVKHSGTKFNGTAITCNSYTGTYCAKFLLPGPQKRRQKLLPFINAIYIDKIPPHSFKKKNSYKEQPQLNSDSYCRQTYNFAWNLFLHAMYLWTWDWLTPYMPVHVKVPPITIVQKVCLCKGLGSKLQWEEKEKTNSEYESLFNM